MDLDEAFGHTFRAMLGKTDCALKIDDFRDYFLEYMLPYSIGKSAVSGKEVTIVSEEYCKGAKFISQDEIKEVPFEPLSINEIKDIDSILEAIEGRMHYSGNKILGNSDFAKNVDLCIDSFYVRDSHNIQQSKYIAYGWMIRDNSEFVFGAGGMGEGKQVIRCIAAFNITRCFESYYMVDTSDAYFSYNCTGCSNIMFSFNQRGNRYLIGNTPLQKDKYLGLKNKLLGEVREKLLCDKQFPSLFSIPVNPEIELPAINAKERTGEQNMGKMERDFSMTTKILFGKELGPIRKFDQWLSGHSLELKERKTPFGRITYSISLFPFMRDVSEGRFVTDDEAIELARISFDPGPIDGASMEKAFSLASKIAYYSPEIYTGKSQNIIETPIAVNSSDIYRIGDSTNSRHSGVSGAVLNSEYVFGSNRAIHSRFCINCYHSLDLTNCFEMDSCSHSRDSMFCHNCENLQECMFCFNTKSKRYAIGNVEVGKDAYLAMKARILGQILRELEKTGGLKHDIYNIGCIRAKVSE
ncbi:MAG: hypothetical protein ABIF01_03045 [Candidatus Micrarchaeota archaeon]